MWKPWMEAHAARMKARASNLLEDIDDLSKPITNGNDSRNRREEWKKKTPEAKKKQIEGLIKTHDIRVQQARERRENLPVIEHVVRVRGKMGRLVGSKNFPYEYPNCPKCDSTRVKRAGFDGDEQRYKCLECKKTFGNVNRVVISVHPYHVTCYRCGGIGNFVSRVVHTKRRTTHGGIIGYCPSCNKNFTQGGPEHLDRTMCLLVARTEKLTTDKLVQIEVLQQASIEVLEGLAYTWNVPLNISQAKSMVYDYSKETKKFRQNERGEKPSRDY